MALKLKVKTLDEVPEALRGEYEKDGEEFVLKVDGLEDTGGLKSALHKERDRANTNEKLAKRYAALGKTPEEIQALLEKDAADEAARAQKAGDYDKLLTQVKEQHAKELDKFAGREKSLKATVEKHLVDGAAATAIAEQKGVPTLLLPHVKEHTRVVETEGGTFEVRVVNDKGEPRVKADGSFMTIGDLVTEMRANEVFARAFEGTTASGGGKPNGGDGGGPAASGFNRSKMTVDEKSAYIAKYGNEKYLALPW